MECELTQKEFNHLEQYRKLFPEFQKALDQQTAALYKLQINIFKDALKKQ